MSDAPRDEIEPPVGAPAAGWATAGFVVDLDLISRLPFALLLLAGITLIYANPGWSMLTGRSAHELGTADWLDGIHPADRDDAEQFVRAATGRPTEARFRAVTAAGEELELQARTRLLPTAHDRADRVLGIRPVVSEPITPDPPRRRR